MIHIFSWTRLIPRKQAWKMYTRDLLLPDSEDNMRAVSGSSTCFIHWVAKLISLCLHRSTSVSNSSAEAKASTLTKTRATT